MSGTDHAPEEVKSQEPVSSVRRRSHFTSEETAAREWQSEPQGQQAALGPALSHGLSPVMSHCFSVSGHVGRPLSCSLPGTPPAVRGPGPSRTKTPVMTGAVVTAASVPHIWKSPAGDPGGSCNTGPFGSKGLWDRSRGGPATPWFLPSDSLGCSFRRRWRSERQLGNLHASPYASPLAGPGLLQRGLHISPDYSNPGSRQRAAAAVGGLQPREG